MRDADPKRQVPSPHRPTSPSPSPGPRVLADEIAGAFNARLDELLDDRLRTEAGP